MINLSTSSVTTEGGTGMLLLLNTKGRENDSCLDNDNGNKNDIPSDLWPNIIRFLPYQDLLSCSILNKFYLKEVMPQIRLLEIYKPSHLHIAPLYRFTGVKDVYVNCLVYRDEEQPINTTTSSNTVATNNNLLGQEEQVASDATTTTNYFDSDSKVNNKVNDRQNGGENDIQMQDDDQILTIENEYYGDDDDDDDQNLQILCEETAERLVHFLSKIPKLQRAWVGGFSRGLSSSSRHGAEESFPSQYHYNKSTYFSYDTRSCYYPYNHEEIFQNLIRSVCSAYRCGILSPELTSLDGIICSGFDDDSYEYMFSCYPGFRSIDGFSNITCDLCYDICRSLPISWVMKLRCNAEEDATNPRIYNEEEYHMLLGANQVDDDEEETSSSVSSCSSCGSHNWLNPRGSICLSPKQKLEIISKRRGGKEFLSSSASLSCCLSKSISWNGIDHVLSTSYLSKITSPPVYNSAASSTVEVDASCIRQPLQFPSTGTTRTIRTEIDLTDELLQEIKLLVNKYKLDPHFLTPEFITEECWYYQMDDLLNSTSSDDGQRKTRRATYYTWELEGGANSSSNTRNDIAHKSFFRRPQMKRKTFDWLVHECGCTHLLPPGKYFQVIDR